MPAEQEFLTETDTEIMRVIHDADLFVPDSFEALPFGFDITLIVGQPREQTLIQMLLNPEKLMVQAVKFKKPPWDMAEALDWLQDNQKHFNSINNLKKYAHELKSIDNVEIFSAGVWNGDKYTVADLEIMVKAFDENSEGFRPPLKLGHSNKQALLQEDGMPAAGWVGKLFIKGEKLMANFIDIPKKIFDLINNKAYRKVSSEIYWDMKLGDNLYKRALGAVSLLGADNPGVSNLSDILANYKISSYKTIKSYGDNLESKIYNQEDKSMPKTEIEIGLEKDLEAQAAKTAELELQVKEFTVKKTEDDAELAELKQFKADQEVKLQEAEVKAKEAELKAFITELKAEKLMTPSMEQHVTDMLSDKKEYSIKDKAATKQEVFKDMLKLFKKASEVNFDESSLDIKSENNNT